jgi:prolyl-tRNA editing enzyme YbaK/EbsC (Cys-tRNA(Pro) deacylase)
VGVKINPKLMTISKKIQKYLEDKKYKFSVIDHKTTFTAWDTAQTEKIDPKMVAKALVMKGDNDYFLALVPGNKNLDKQKLLKTINVQRKKQGILPHQNLTKNTLNKTLSAKNKKSSFGVGVKKIDFAKEVWMKKNLPGKVGATPPFFDLIKLEIFADSLLLKNKKIYVGSGEYTESILINVSEYIKKENIIKGSFSKKK